jgi:hypothetical protein
MNPAYAIPGSVSCILNPGDPMHKSPAVLQRAPGRATTFHGEDQAQAARQGGGEGPVRAGAGQGSDPLSKRGPRI